MILRWEHLFSSRFYYSEKLCTHTPISVRNIKTTCSKSWMIIENNEILLWMFMRNLNIKLYKLKLSSCFMPWTIQVKHINYHINIMIWILIKCFFLRYKIYDINIGISWLHMTYYTLSINYYFDVKESSLKLYFIFYIIFFSFLGSWSFGYFLLHQLGGSYLRPGKILPSKQFFFTILEMYQAIPWDNLCLIHFLPFCLSVVQQYTKLCFYLFYICIVHIWIK